MPFDRRITLFAVCAVLCFALTPLAGDDYDHVPPIVGAVYVVLTILFGLDWLSRRHAARRR